MPDHDRQRPDGLSAIEAIRLPIRAMPDRFPHFETIDIAMGALYAAHDLACRAGMSQAEAVEWLRNGADVMEGQLLDRAGAKH